MQPNQPPPSQKTSEETRLQSALSSTQIQLQALEQLDREALAQRFEQVFEIPAPQRSRDTLLKLALGWQLQMQAKGQTMGKRSQSPLQHLHQISKLLHSSAPRTVTHGARLIREWKGVTHEVEVIDEGYRYQGQTFKSLSAVAKAITGTPWSGPVFFGLKSKPFPMAKDQA